MNKPWNCEMQINFDERHRETFKVWYENLVKNKKYRGQSIIISTPIDEGCLKYLNDMYNSGYGLKILARELGITYSNIRTIFEKLGIEIRKGRSVVTGKVKKFRSERVTGTKNPWSDWECRKNVHSRGIQGFYVDRKGRRIWLRSTWEYIYAKWLDSNRIDWEYEGKQYVLSSGESYRPDFTIIDNGSIRIVEIKGYLKDKLYKVNMLREEYDLDVSVIDDISMFCKNYNEELAEWKFILKQKK